MTRSDGQDGKFSGLLFVGKKNGCTDAQGLSSCSLEVTLGGGKGQTNWVILN